MASIRKVIHESGRTSWQARWRDPAGAQRSKNFDRRGDAQRHFTIDARKLASTYVDPRASRPKLGELTKKTTVGWLNRRDSTRRSSMSTATYPKASTETQPTISSRPGADLMWTRRQERRNPGRGLT